MSRFRDDPGERRFELEEGGHVAFADYRIEPNGVRVIRHVEAPPALRGTGAAKRLMDAAVAHARLNGFKLRARCPYAVAYFERYPKERDVLG
ncbi:MAG TPA: GNAT family N-acetyltransferase [Caulobacterales bacterium]|nr:GNAT family N-acetyltransferase [Caulobacterales bacterium]